MELLRGGTVADRLRAGEAIPHRVALRWLDEAGSALDAAHEEGIVHRDVKPANLLLDERGRLAIADFGIARLGLEDQITQTGQVLGTAAYISPEQAIGEPATAGLGPLRARRRRLRAADRRQAVRGRELRRPGPRARRGRRRRSPPSATSTSRPPSTPCSTRGMAKEPGDRWPTAGALVRALDDALAPRRAAAPRPPRPTPPARSARRRRAPPPPRRRRAAAAGAGSPADRPRRRAGAAAFVALAARCWSSRRRPALITRDAATTPRAGARPRPRPTGRARPRTTPDAGEPEPTPRRPRPPTPTRDARADAEPTATPEPAATASATTRPCSSCARSSSTTRATTRRRCRSPRRPSPLRGLDRDQPVRVRPVRVRQGAAADGRPASAVAALEERIQRFPDNQRGGRRGRARAAPRAAAGQGDAEPSSRRGRTSPGVRFMSPAQGRIVYDHVRAHPPRRGARARHRARRRRGVHGGARWPTTAPGALTTGRLRRAAYDPAPEARARPRRRGRPGHGRCARLLLHLVAQGAGRWRERTRTGTWSRASTSSTSTARRTRRSTASPSCWSRSCCGRAAGSCSTTSTWTYADDPARDATDGVVHRELAEPERTEPHLRAVFDLIVAQHPSFTELRRPGRVVGLGSARRPAEPRR